MTSEVCSHRDAKSAGYRVRAVRTNKGLADPLWAVHELFTCACEQRLHRMVGVVRAPDEREAARLCGVAPADCERIPVESRNSKPVESPSTGWPFPCSAHEEKPR